jgi:hypothetical protein
MHDDPAGGDQLTVDELTGLLAALILSDSYYCDYAEVDVKPRSRGLACA